VSCGVEDLVVRSRGPSGCLPIWYSSSIENSTQFESQCYSMARSISRVVLRSPRHTPLETTHRHCLATQRNLERGSCYRVLFLLNAPRSTSLCIYVFSLFNNNTLPLWDYRKAVNWNIFQHGLLWPLAPYLARLFKQRWEI
jgi:hypothetical protein